MNYMIKLVFCDLILEVYKICNMKLWFIYIRCGFVFIQLKSCDKRGIRKENIVLSLNV